MANVLLRALRVTPGGAISPMVLTSGAGGQLGAIREQIGCSMVEPVGLGPDLVVWCDEKAFRAAEPRLNLCATGVAPSHGRLEQPYVGTAVFTGSAVGGGDLEALSEQQAEDLRRECAYVIRSVAMLRHCRPACSPVDEVRLVQGECVRDVAIGAR